ncbi:MAG TPA: cupin domain-containing protein [Stellaceae bacterium]|jgi:predicted cupin superfamily sugar epimerase|nr:cupin domain-containing protein [Stellaceae bacterium]
MDAQAIIDLLGLQPHPEGGYYRETWRDEPGEGGPDESRRGSGTAIYFLLPAGQVSAWHRVDAVEIWHWHAGAPLQLDIAADGKRESRILGNDLAAGQRPQGIVPKDAWQSAKSLGDWTLVGCTVSPAFRFEGFEMGVPGWEP